METSKILGFVQFDIEAEFLTSMDNPKLKPEVRAQGWDMGLWQGPGMQAQQCTEGNRKAAPKERQPLKHNTALTEYSTT